MANHDLSKMAKQYRRERLTPNPPVDDYNSILNEFCYKLKLEGKKIGKWSDEQWIDAILDLGIPEEEVCMVMENVASWSVDG